MKISFGGGEEKSLSMYKVQKYSVPVVVKFHGGGWCLESLYFCVIFLCCHTAATHDTSDT